jgi:hypothetical protein
MFRPHLLQLSFVFLLAIPAWAKTGKGTKYYLRVHVLKASYGCIDCDGVSNYRSIDGPTIDPDNHYSGRGRAVFLLDANKTNDFGSSIPVASIPFPPQTLPLLPPAGRNLATR